MRFSALAISLAAFAALLLVAYGDVPFSSLATSPPSAQRFSLDMDPAGSPANTATSLGSREPCAAMSEDNFLNFDEDFTDTVEFDVTAIGIPASNPMIAYVYTLTYPAPSTSIVYQQSMMIGPPVVIQNLSDPLPDTDGTFNVSVADPSGPAESGSGVLDRLRIQTNPGATAGTFPLTLTNAAHVDTNANSWAPDALDNAIIQINGGCPLLADIEMVSMALTSANPVPFDTSSSVAVDTTIRNNGPQPANSDSNTTFAVPSGCTLNGTGGTVVLNAGLGVMAPGSSQGLHQVASLRCTSPGPHQMPVTACGQVDDPSAVDPTSGNGCMSQNLSFSVTFPDTDGDGYTDDAEAGTPLCGDGRNEDGVIAGGAADDGVIDDGCPGGSPQAGSYSEAQFNIGTNPLDSCGTDGNPADLVSGGIPSSTNNVNILDLTSFLAPVRRIDTSPGQAAYNKRWDIVPGRGLFSNWTNIADLVSVITVRPPVSPWNGTRAFGGPACSP